MATRKIFLVQTVRGDAGGASAVYALTARGCIRSLPPAMRQHNAVDGIRQLPGSTTVELREGRFNITAAVASSATEGVSALALDAKGEPCTARVAVSNLPAHCTAAEPTNVVTANLAHDADDQGRVILEHVIDCAKPEFSSLPPLGQVRR